jgi:hypothetical protein
MFVVRDLGCKIQERAILVERDAALGPELVAAQAQLPRNPSVRPSGLTKGLHDRRYPQRAHHRPGRHGFLTAAFWQHLSELWRGMSSTSGARRPSRADVGQPLRWVLPCPIAVAVPCGFLGSVHCRIGGVALAPRAPTRACRFRAVGTRGTMRATMETTNGTTRSRACHTLDASSTVWNGCWAGRTGLHGRSRCSCSRSPTSTT